MGELPARLDSHEGPVRAASLWTKARLRNLGPRSFSMLTAAGIAGPEALRRLGAVAAFARVRQSDPRASLNLLWALEGALTDLDWKVVAREHRTSLLLALESHEQRR